MAQGLPDYIVTNVRTATVEDRRYYGNGGGTSYAKKWHPRMLQTWRGVTSRTVEDHLLSSYVSSQRYAIVAVDIVNKYFYVSGDQTGVTKIGSTNKICVRGSTGNDYEGVTNGYNNPYQVTATSYNAGTDQTQITVSQTPASAVADGWVYTGRLIFQPGRYHVSGNALVRGSSTQTGAIRLVDPTGFSYDENGCMSVEGPTVWDTGLTQYTGSLATLGDCLLTLDDDMDLASETVIEMQEFTWVALANCGLGTSIDSSGGTPIYSKTAQLTIIRIN